MFDYHKLIISILMIITLSGCNKTKEVLGLSRQQYNEFGVMESAPLSLPKDYELTPPGKEKNKNLSKRKTINSSNKKYKSILQQMDQ